MMILKLMFLFLLINVSEPRFTHSFEPYFMSSDNKRRSKVRLFLELAMFFWENDKK